MGNGNIKMRAILLYARGYSFVNKETGEKVEGITIQYYPNDDMCPLDDPDNGSKGFQVMNDTLPYAIADKVKSVPGIYDLSCQMSTAKLDNGKTIPRLQVKDVKYISDYMPTQQPEAGKSK